MRRKEREVMKMEEIRQILDGFKVCRLGLVDDGKPYIVPMNMAYDLDDGELSIYFHCAKGVGHKVENMYYQEQVCFTVVGKTKILPEKFSTCYESVIVFGRAREIFLGKEIALMALIEKYSPDYLEKGKRYIEKDAGKTGVYEITIEKISGKARR